MTAGGFGILAHWVLEYAHTTLGTIGRGGLIGPTSSCGVH